MRSMMDGYPFEAYIKVKGFLCFKGIVYALTPYEALSCARELYGMDVEVNDYMG